MNPMVNEDTQTPPYETDECSSGFGKVAQIQTHYYSFLSSNRINVPEHLFISSSVDVEVFTERIDDSLPRQMIRSPLLRLGKWKRGKRTAEFSQDDFDSIIQNFQANTLGFEPPLFLGHPSDVLTIEGAPAVGFLVSIDQQGDVLWGDFEVVDPDAYAAVVAGKYRYASAELVRNSTNPETGQTVPLMLVGHALTNRPFIPNLPRNKSWQPQEIYSVHHSLPKDTDMSIDQSVPVKTSESKPVAATTDSSTAMDTVKELFAAQLEQVKSEFQKQVDQLKSENEVVRQQLAAAQEELRQTRIQKRLSELEAMNLAKPVKEKYQALVRQQALGEHEEAIFEALQMMASIASKEMFTQYGHESVMVSESNKTDDNPYSSQIEENERLAASLRQNARMAIFGKNA